MTAKKHDTCCTSCGAQGVGVIETRFVIVNSANKYDSLRLCHGMPVKSYIRRRRHCLSCNYRFSTAEISQEDIEATCLELKNLRGQVAKQKIALQLLLDLSALDQQPPAA